MISLYHDAIINFLVLLVLVAPGPVFTALIAFEFASLIAALIAFAFATLMH
jgi:hypothetical protein